MTTHTVDYESLAKEAAGNWMKFDSFAWHERPHDSEKWCIVYTHNRDSDLLTQSNAAAIEKAMEPFCQRGTARAERHNHWACGWVDGYSIRVYTGKGVITRAFKKWCDLKDALDDYPVLDDEDFSKREWEATIENWSDELGAFLRNYDGPVLLDKEPEAAELWDHMPERARECRDGGGGWANKEDIKEALVSFGYLPDDDDPSDMIDALMKNELYCYRGDVRRILAERCDRYRRGEVDLDMIYAVIKEVTGHDHQG